MKRTYRIVIFIFSMISTTAWAYSGGTGEPNDPYQIATAEDLIALGNEPNDYNDCFILTANIDLSGYVFDRAVIAPDVEDDYGSGFQGTEFGGSFDGQGHIIRNLRLQWEELRDYLGLFGWCSSGAFVSNLGLETVDVNGYGDYVGGLVGYNNGTVISSSSTGSINGYNRYVGGLVGYSGGTIISSYSTVWVCDGLKYVGGLVGENSGSITSSYSTGTINSKKHYRSEYVGGLAGRNEGAITSSFSTSSISYSGENEFSGGLVGVNGGSITSCYSSGSVSQGSGLVVRNWGSITSSYSTATVGSRGSGFVGNNYYGSITLCFWDTEVSGQSDSAGGIGLTTVEMQDVQTYIDAGWDLVGETAHGTCDFWVIQEGGYPSLAVFSGVLPADPNGTGTQEDPYLLTDANELGSIWNHPRAYYRLEEDVDLNDIAWNCAVVPGFGGFFDGNGHVISNLSIEGGGYLGLFGMCASDATISSLGLDIVDVNGTGDYVGGLVGRNNANITSSYSTGSVRSGDDSFNQSVAVGGLVGRNDGSITASYSTVTVNSEPGYKNDVGGLVGANGGTITSSYSTGSVSSDGSDYVGGLAGDNWGIITSSYSTGSVSDGYSWYVGGLVGDNGGTITSSFWDTETSGQTDSDGGTGLTTAEMQDIDTFLDAGWDFAGETDNGTDETWFMPVGSYPWLACSPGYYTTVPDVSGLTVKEAQEVLVVQGFILAALTYQFSNVVSGGHIISQGLDPGSAAFTGTIVSLIVSGGTLNGSGTAEDPYQITNGDSLSALGAEPSLYSQYFVLTADIDLSSYSFEQAVIAPQTISGKNDGRGIRWSREGGVFEGHFNGQGHVITNIRIQGQGYLGLFGLIGAGAEITNLGLESVIIEGEGDYGSYVGGLVGYNEGGTVTSSYCTGSVSGDHFVGGLVGDNNEGTITACYSMGFISGDYSIGGLVGSNYDGTITSSYSVSSVSGDSYVGGLVAMNSEGSITSSYSTGSVSGNDNVGGLVGMNYEGSVTSSFWDIETSGQNYSPLGISLTSSEMMNPQIFALNGWAQDPNWIMDSGQDYPRLSWQGTIGQVISEPTMDWIAGEGTIDAPYQIETVEQFDLISKASVLADKHFLLINDLDLAGFIWTRAVILVFSGRFDGNGNKISNLTIQGAGDLGLFGRLESGAGVANLGLEAVDVTGTIDCVGALVGYNDGGTITSSYSTGSISGDDYVGGLVGKNYGPITLSYSMASVSGDRLIGGLMGYNGNGFVTSSYSTGSIHGDDCVGGLVGENHGLVASSYSTASIRGDDCVGGLVGYNSNDAIISCYSTGSVSGYRGVGGLVGWNFGPIISSYSNGSVSGYDCIAGLVGCNHYGSITSSYSIGLVSGNRSVGGLVADNRGSITSSFWDTGTSGMAESDGGTGLTTVEMQYIDTFLGAGWDFVGETANGTSNYWMIQEGTYPSLAVLSGVHPIEPNGSGNQEDPYLLTDANELGVIWYRPWAHYRLEADIDLNEIAWNCAVVPEFSGSFDGNGHVISNLDIEGGGFLGLFGKCISDVNIISLGLVAVDVNGTGNSVGGLVGYKDGSITSSYSTGSVSGDSNVGGLVGYSYYGLITSSYSTGSVSGDSSVGGLVGHFSGNKSSPVHITASYSTGSVCGNSYVGGLVGSGGNSDRVTSSFWDMEASGQADSDGGVGLTTVQMQDINTFLNAGWDFVGETANGTDDTWAMLEADYPRLWWEISD